MRSQMGAAADIPATAHSPRPPSPPPRQLHLLHRTLALALMPGDTAALAAAEAQLAASGAGLVALAQGQEAAMAAIHGSG